MDDHEPTNFSGHLQSLRKELQPKVNHESFEKLRLARPRAAAEAGSVYLPHPSFHLFIDTRYAQEYWLHLAVQVEESLASVDYFLRKTWVECCEHMSAFTIAGKRYAYRPFDGSDQSGMDTPLSRVLQPGMVFKYEYDFGSTTELRLKVVGFWNREIEGNAIELLARNDAPQVACHRCGKHLATQICTNCQWGGEGWLCDDCAEEHECGSESLLPVVNSPRAGVCGYGG